MAVREGVRTEAAYWDADVARSVIARYGYPNVIIARNVIPHVSELHYVIEGIHSCSGR